MIRLGGNRDARVMIFSIQNAEGFITKIHHLPFQEGQKLQVRVTQLPRLWLVGLSIPKHLHFCLVPRKQLIWLS